MAKGKKYTAQGEQLDLNAWMVTFSDLVMLLLTFFVMLLTMSSMDTKMLKDIRSSLDAAAGLLEYSGLRRVTSLGKFIQEYQASSDLFVIDHDRLKNLIPSAGLDKVMSEEIKDLNEIMDITDDERGIVLSLQENILFDPGEVKIKKDFFHVLDSISTAIASCPNDILIMGHTDNIPSHSKIYESNWELSSYRALSVLEYFLKEKGLQPSRFSAGGYGPARQLYPNDTPKDRTLNRRVEIIIK
ncbi:MAG: OmpA family protein, partial [Deltaproteobacteria bacterium]|nr:OmpA family protein [Deltaproteobacteria bacterium]